MRACLRVLAFAVSIGAVFPAAVSTQQEAPYSYAITGARVIPVSSPPIDNATVVLSGGVITAIGTNVTVPAGAITITGKGLSV